MGCALWGGRRGGGGGHQGEVSMLVWTYRSWAGGKGVGLGLAEAGFLRPRGLAPRPVSIPSMDPSLGLRPTRSSGCLCASNLPGSKESSVPIWVLHQSHPVEWRNEDFLSLQPWWTFSGVPQHKKLNPVDMLDPTNTHANMEKGTQRHDTELPIIQ